MTFLLAVVINMNITDIVHQYFNIIQPQFTFKKNKHKKDGYQCVYCGT